MGPLHPFHMPTFLLQQGLRVWFLNGQVVYTAAPEIPRRGARQSRGRCRAATHKLGHTTTDTSRKTLTMAGIRMVSPGMFPLRLALVGETLKRIGFWLAGYICYVSTTQRPVQRLTLQGIAVSSG